MHRSHSRLRRLALLPAFVFGGACNDGLSIEPDQIFGAYTATSFRVTPPSQPIVDVLAAGGSLSITIAPDSSTSGTLFIPAGLVGAAAVTASMEGTLFRTSDGTYRFDQPSGTFVSSLAWQQYTDAFVSTSALGGVQFQITLQK